MKESTDPMNEDPSSPLNQRAAPVEMTSEAFRQAGHQTVDLIADFLASLPQRPVTPGETPSQVRSVLGNSALPEHGEAAGELIKETAALLFDHSAFNGHPRFLGYITSSATPLGALGDLLAAAVNPNVGAWGLAPMASEIEAQTIRWIAELIGYPTDCGGLLVSGGNMANFVGFLSARKAKADWDVREQGLAGSQGRSLRLYASSETHTWIHKAADLFGLGTQAIRWIPADSRQRMRMDSLEQNIEADLAAGDVPFLVIGTAGSVSTGAIDPLAEIRDLCDRHALWLHVDGAYGAVAAALPEAEADLKALALADSVALDPHKWLYSPLEAGCILVREAGALVDAFSYRPPYYRFEGQGQEKPFNYYEYGLQNSRGFRALKVWLGLRQAGRQGYLQMIRDDIRLAEILCQLALEHPELEAHAHNLSITTFRYVPVDLAGESGAAEDYLNRLNSEILERMQDEGEAYISNAVIDGRFLLRACVVNFRTSLNDIEALPGIVVRLGRELDRGLRSSYP